MLLSQTGSSTTRYDSIWERLPNALERAMALTGMTEEEAKSALCQAIDDGVVKFRGKLIQVPAGVYLPQGVAFVIDDKTPAINAVYTRCGQFCMAELELKPDVVQMLKSKAKADPGRLEFDDGAQHKIALPVSFKGLPAALAARDEQSP